MKASKVSGRRHVVEKCCDVTKITLALNKNKLQKIRPLTVCKKSMICTTYDV